MRSPRSFTTVWLLLSCALWGAACKKDPPPAPPVPPAAAAIPTGPAMPGVLVDAGVAVAPIAPPRPGDLIATIETSMGTFQIRLFVDKAPATVANFVGLADGTKAWKDPKLGRDVKRPFFDGLPFFSVAPSFAVQTGDPNADGTGGPGYTLPDEPKPDLRHDRPGVVTMAHRGRGTGGSQFMVLLRAHPLLDGRNSVFGEVVVGLEVVEAISRVPAEKHRPRQPIVIRKVSVKKLA